MKPVSVQVARAEGAALKGVPFCALTGVSLKGVTISAGQTGGICHPCHDNFRQSKICTTRPDHAFSLRKCLGCAQRTGRMSMPLRCRLTVISPSFSSHRSHLWNVLCDQCSIGTRRNHTSGTATLGSLQIPPSDPTLFPHPARCMTGCSRLDEVGLTGGFLNVYGPS